MYSSRGFLISDIFGDNEFDMSDFKDTLLPSKLHICASGEHVPKIESTIRTMKGRTRTICHSSPINCFPKIMSRGIVATAIFWVNAFPSSGGIMVTIVQLLFWKVKRILIVTGNDCHLDRMPMHTILPITHKERDLYHPLPSMKPTRKINNFLCLLNLVERFIQENGLHYPLMMLL